MTLCYTYSMKTAISIPDTLFQAAEQARQELAMSRSQFYAAAVHRFVESRRAAAVTARLDEVYAEEDAGLAPDLSELQRRSLDEDRW